MDTLEIFQYEWPYLLSFLPSASILDSTARQYGAFSRAREIKSAEALLRIALVYSFCNNSLRDTAAWATLQGLANISDVALLKRLRKTDRWLGQLLAIKLAERAQPPSVCADLARRIRLVDATCISKPGSTGTDWRLHVGFDLTSFTIDHVDLTDRSGGESLTRFTFNEGDLVIADRGYAHRAGMHAVVRAGADFLVRATWQNIPLQDLSRKPFDLLGALRSLPEGRPAEFSVRIAPLAKQHIPALPARLLAVRKTETAATQARAEVLRERSRKGRNVDPSTLEAAGYTFLLTSLPASVLTATDGLELYRFRWQIEIAFKRLKSLLALDELSAKGEELGRSILCGKLLAALLVEDLTEKFLDFSPWGYRLGTSPTFPLAYSARSH
jgi:hypothetical protein